METYLILNSDNVAETSAIYNQHLENPPINYILVQDTSMLWHKYENGIWSTESYEPIVTPQPTLEDKVNYLYYKSMGVI